MSVEVIDKIKPKNGGKFKIIDSVDVEMTDGTSLEDKISDLSETVDDIYKGKFEGSDFYYTRDEVNNAFYTKKEVEDLIIILENEIDQFQTLEDVKSLIRTFYPIGLEQIDYDFEVYLRKTDLQTRVKEILDSLEVSSGGTVDVQALIDQLKNEFYTKEETLNKEEIHAEITKVVNETELANTLSASFYNKEEVETKVSEIKTTYDSAVIEINANFANHVNDSNNKFTALETSLSDKINAVLESRVPKVDFESLVSNIDSHIEDYTKKVSEIYDDLCDEIEVTEIIEGQLAEGNLLDSAITEKVDDKYRELDTIVKNVDYRLGNYAQISYVEQEIDNLESLIQSLEGMPIDGNGETIFIKLKNIEQDYINLNDKITKILGELNPDTEGYKDVKSRIETLELRTSELGNNISNLIITVNGISTDLATLEESFNADHDILTEINENTIPSLTNEVNIIQENIVSHKTSIDDLQARVNVIGEDLSIQGLDAIKEDIVALNKDIETLRSLPVMNDMGELEAVEGSVYDIVMSSNNMNYTSVEGIDTKFKAQDFYSDIIDNKENIDKNTRSITESNAFSSSLATRLAYVESKQADHTSSINEIGSKMDTLDQYEDQFTTISTNLTNIKIKVDEMDALTPTSIITKINNTNADNKMVSSNINLRGAISYNELSGDLTALLTKNNKGVYINGKMLVPNSLKANNVDFKGLSIEAIEKDDSKLINKYETFGISDLGIVTITNANIKTSGFSSNDNIGYEFNNGKAILNDAIIKGKFIMSNGGIHGLDDEDIRLWIGVGEDEKEKAPFKVLSNGHLVASNAKIGGTVVPSELHNGNIHLENNEIKINNTIALLNSDSDELEIHKGEVEEEYICINSRESRFNTNIRIGDNIKYDIALNKLDVKSKLSLTNGDNKLLFNDKGITLDTDTSTHRLYKNEAGTLINESGKNSSVSDPDFLFTSKNSVRDCSVKINGSLEVTEEIKTDKNNVVLRSTENGFAFFAI